MTSFLPLFLLSLFQTACFGKETCSTETVSGCGAVESCCAGDTCYVQTEGATFDCDGSDCTAANDQLGDYCAGADGGSCTAPSGYTCSTGPIGDCEVQTCCDGDDCMYIANCETFACDGTNCDDASADVVAYCN